ncbi:oligomeric Golgi complex component [Tieghemostelium lacteum]|uniref:Conserved oligomeric Golgi complex subunit 2 n=1 Tax=Tieghemostelium lacteum TaxID=361077 RepID=A0A151ZG39_TIELA|nr:oligomeric Golgi complex component [Tieghemostelium lacteum]|eukprot:KYQ92936.1 oligomeric Golgi complex component [Tieghemostelium lacteum]
MKSSTSSLSLAKSTSISSNLNTLSSTTLNRNEYIPLCFSKDIFESDGFEVDTFIADCRKRVNLESIQKDLREYSKNVDSELIELINKEYQSFFSLSSSLVGIDHIINDFNITQSSIKSEILTFKSEINKVKESVQHRLIEKKQIENNKKLLQLYISILESCNNMNNLFDKLFQLSDKDYLKQRQQDINNNINNNSNSNLTLEFIIDRISQSFYQIQNQMSSLSADELKLAIFQTVQQKVLDISTQIESKIEPIFKESLKNLINTNNNSNSDILISCLKTYLILHKLNIPYRIFKSIIVKPYFSNIITLNNLNTLGLPKLYENILNFIRNDCSQFFKIVTIVNQNSDNNNNNNSNSNNNGSSNSISREKELYNFTSESILPEIDDSLGPLKQIFATGIPDLFFKNYNETTEFIATLEDIGLNHQRELLIQFRQSTAYQNLWKRWNFAVYFQLRFTEIASKFESDSNFSVPIFQQLSIPVVIDQKIEYFLRNSAILIQALDHCWSKSIFIYELSSKFLKLFLQLLARYQYYITESLQSYELQQQQQQQLPTQQQNKQTLPENFVFIVSDLVRVKERVNGYYRDLIIGTINSQSVEISQLISKSIAEINKVFDELIPKLSAIITQYLISKSSESLEFINTIRSTYRMTNKPAPTKSSIYVPSIISPIELFIANKAYTIPSQLKVDWITTILTPVTKQFKQNAINVLESVNTSNEFIKHLIKKPTKQQQQQQQGELTDLDKMSMQLYLDVEKYSGLLQKLLPNYFDINTFDPLIDLKNLVEPFKKLGTNQNL